MSHNPNANSIGVSAMANTLAFTGVPTAPTATTATPVEIKCKLNTSVTFKTVIGILGDTSKALTEHLLSVSELHDSCLNTFGLTDISIVTFTFADDVEDKVYDGLQILKNSPHGELQIDITYHQKNSNVPIRTLRLINPAISAITLGKLEYNRVKDDYLNIKVDVSHTGFTKI